MEIKVQLFSLDSYDSVVIIKLIIRRILEFCCTST